MVHLEIILFLYRIALKRLPNTYLLLKYIKDIIYPKYFIRSIII